MKPTDDAADFRDSVLASAEELMAATGFAISIAFCPKKKPRGMTRCTIRVDEESSPVEATQVRYECVQDANRMQDAIRIACAEHARKLA